MVSCYGEEVSGVPAELGWFECPPQAWGSWHLVALLGEAVEPVEGGALLEEPQHWGLALSVY